MWLHSPAGPGTAGGGSAPCGAIAGAADGSADDKGAGPAEGAVLLSRPSSGRRDAGSSGPSAGLTSSAAGGIGLGTGGGMSGTGAGSGPRMAAPASLPAEVDAGP